MVHEWTQGRHLHGEGGFTAQDSQGRSSETGVLAMVLARPAKSAATAGRAPLARRAKEVAPRLGRAVCEKCVDLKPL